MDQICFSEQIFYRKQWLSAPELRGAKMSAPSASGLPLVSPRRSTRIRFCFKTKFFLQLALPSTHTKFWKPCFAPLVWMHWKRRITLRCWISVHRMFSSKMVPFSINITFSHRRELTIQKRNEWTRIFLKTEQKSPFSNKHCKNGYVWTGPSRDICLCW